MAGMETTAGVILAGGISARFGASKALALVQGKPLIRHVIDRAVGQVARIIVSENDPISGVDLAAFPKVRDTIGPGRGPLAGTLAAMDWLIIHEPHCDHIATFPVDSPLFPLDLVVRLARMSDGTAPVVPVSAGQLHAAFGLWPISLRARLAEYLASGHSGAQKFCTLVAARTVEFQTVPFDPFFNVNHPHDLEFATEIMARRGQGY